MKFKYLPMLSLVLLLGACGTTTNSSSSSSVESDGVSSSTTSTSTSSSSESDELTMLKAQYGQFSISGDATLSSDNKTYVINVGASKKEIVISGYSEYKFIIKNGDNLADFKGVKITLSNACLASTSGTVIEYQLSKKNVSIISSKGTTNYIINTGSGEDDNGVLSSNHVELDVKNNSTLNLKTYTGHCIDAEEEIRVYGKGTVSAYAGHDAFHGKYFYSNNQEEAEEDYEDLSGTVKVTYALSQAFDCSSNKAKGAIELTSGSFVISNCESVFKTDKTLTIASGVTVTATNISSDPVVRGENSTGVTITNNGTFTVNGTAYSKTSV